jgi:hypothetical protein
MLNLFVATRDVQLRADPGRRRPPGSATGSAALHPVDARAAG